MNKLHFLLPDNLDIRVGLLKKYEHSQRKVYHEKISYKQYLLKLGLIL
jgi:hypothetical protein